MKKLVITALITGSAFLSSTAFATPKTCLVSFLSASCVRPENQVANSLSEARFDLNIREPNRGFAVTELKLAPLVSSEGYETSSHRLEVFSSESLLQVRVVKSRTGSGCGNFNTCDMRGEFFGTSALTPFSEGMEFEGQIRDFNGQCLNVVCW